MDDIDFTAWEAQEPSADLGARIVEIAIENTFALERVIAARQQIERLICAIEDDLVRDEVSEVESLLRSLTDNHRSAVTYQRMRKQQRQPVLMSAEPPTIFEVRVMLEDMLPSADTPPMQDATKKAG